MAWSRILHNQQAYFRTGATLPPAFRKQALRALRRGLKEREGLFLDALAADLGKSGAEAYMTELSMVDGEIKYALRHLEAWSAPRRRPPSLSQTPGVNILYPEPYGAALIVSPWNYPYLLALGPLTAAIAAGNCALVKLSPYAPATSQAIAKLIAGLFPPDYVATAQGGREVNQELFALPFDKIFFTGSPQVGKVVMGAAAGNLTPVTLELGGVNPCIVDRTADLDLAARRIWFGKLLAAGQTCVAPDYILVDHTIRDVLVAKLRMALRHMVGSALDCPSYPRIVNREHFDRLRGLLACSRVICGGEADEGALRMAPALIDARPGDRVLEEEIFGPLLPLVPYRRLEDAISYVASRPKPLALYLFTREPEHARRVTQGLSFGGGCVNDTVVHMTSPRAPFGGVGQSGMGNYHGKYGFEAFSRQKTVCYRAGWMDFSVRYQPYTRQKLAVLRRVLR